jgi:enoyl-CoA hydratase
MAQDSSDPLLLSRSGFILLLQLNVPEKRNALATFLLEAIANHLANAAADAQCRVVILSGGADLFAAGADIDELAAMNSAEPLESPRYNAWQRIRAFPKPLLAAVEGWCLGAGLELALSADLIVAGEAARFGQPETNLGLIPGGGATCMLPRRVGRGLATHMIFSGKPISAQQARNAGLVSEVVVSGDALARARQIACEWADRPPLALIEAKASVRAAEELPLSQQFYDERRRFIRVRDTQDAKEGIAAFREKRIPEWRGR